MIIQKYIVALLVVLGLVGSVEAQWKTAINAGLGLTSGNSETSSFTAGIESRNTNDVTQIHWSLDGAYGEAEVNGVEDTTTEKAEAAASYRHIFSDPTYGYFNGSLLYDAIAHVNYRGILGPGVGTYLVKNATWDLGVELGATLIFEELENISRAQSEMDGEEEGRVAAAEENIAVRIGQFYTRKLSDTANVWQSLEYLPLFDDFDDFLLSAELGIESSVNENMSLRLVAGNRYDATPAGGSEKNDFTLTGGLSYKL